MLKALENSSVVKKRRLQWEIFCMQMSVQTDPKPGLEYFANKLSFFQLFLNILIRDQNQKAELQFSDVVTKCFRFIN